ncbi:hypothetical protein DV515_00006192 [Chloebia gouldiae]|uniref:AB hydrolase-1 domain-containing protein n=1 Tax=Chloebia gouldiae TaxID=44316 RepID=A0A3L8SLX7_CHLGU|nr:hypothetical protein DV515_00006192 [Chloebia gouldiae]
MGWAVTGCRCGTNTFAQPGYQELKVQLHSWNSSAHQSRCLCKTAILCKHESHVKPPVKGGATGAISTHLLIGGHVNSKCQRGWALTQRGPFNSGDDRATGTATTSRVRRASGLCLICVLLELPQGVEEHWLLYFIFGLNSHLGDTTAPTSSEDATKQKKALNPEALMNVSQIICHRGYPSEEYEVLTRDGYYIHLNRIPHGREKPKNRGAKAVVFLQHGIFGEGSHWVENLANNSLGFILADSGYDVWLANSRGTSWSQRHQHLSADQVEFWDFSFHEMAMYDLPATIDFVLQKTGQKQLHYVGYSQGCSIAFIAFSSMPELAQKVKMFFALAPVVSLKHTRSPFMKMQVLMDNKLSMIPLLLGRTDASLRIRKLWRFLPELCRHTLLHRPCANLLFLLGGYNEKNLNLTRLDVYTSHYPDGTSVKNIIHWAQVIKSGEFKAFDYGSKNTARYHQVGAATAVLAAGDAGGLFRVVQGQNGFLDHLRAPVSLQDTPPLYRVEEMPVPTAVWSGGQDWAADWRDVLQLLPRISHLVTYTHIPDWNHWDFVWGLDAPGRLYSSILKLMEGSW